MREGRKVALENNFRRRLAKQVREGGGVNGGNKKNCRQLGKSGDEHLGGSKDSFRLSAE